MISEQYLIDVRLKRESVASFDAYPFALDAVRNLSTIRLHPAVTYFIGDNGSGKSTLLEAIAVAWGFNPEGGSKNFSFATHASHSELHKFLRLSRGTKKPRDGFFLRAESYFNVASEIHRLDQDPVPAPPIVNSFGRKPLHEQSHGESFFALLEHRFGGNGLYMLDEPEAALSPTRQMSMLTRMHQLIKARSQFIIATHSPIVMAYPESTIYHLGAGGISEVKYDQTEHVQVTRDFLKRPSYFLKILLDESRDA